MVSVLKLTNVKDEAAGADDIMPLVIYIVLKSCPQRLYSNIKFNFFIIYIFYIFIKIFSNKEEMLKG